MLRPTLQKNSRDEQALWEQIVTCVSKHTCVIWAHSVCLECAHIFKEQASPDASACKGAVQALWGELK